MDWITAVQSCRLKDANLVSIDSEDEKNQLFDYLSINHYPESFWTSANDLMKHNEVKWLRTGQSVNHVFIMPEMTLNTRTACGLLVFNYSAHAMKKTACSETHKYICKTDVPKTITFSLY